MGSPTLQESRGARNAPDANLGAMGFCVARRRADRDGFEDRGRCTNFLSGVRLAEAAPG
jgi:hypothetical protein